MTCFMRLGDKVQSVLGCIALRASLGSATQNFVSAWDDTAAQLECR